MRDFTRLREVLSQLVVLPDSAWNAVLPLLSQRTVQAGQQLLRAGEPASLIFFVHTGLLREFYVDFDGRSATRRFCPEGELSGSLADLLSGAPAMCSIDVIEAGELWQLEWRAFDALTARFDALMLLSRRFAEQLYLRKTKREFEMLTLSAGERYRRFVQDFPVLDARLPRHLVASYLGITPVHLSRLRAADTATPRATVRPRRS